MYGDAPTQASAVPCEDSQSRFIEFHYTFGIGKGGLIQGCKDTLWFSEAWMDLTHTHCVMKVQVWTRLFRSYDFLHFSLVLGHVWSIELCSHPTERRFSILFNWMNSNNNQRTNKANNNKNPAYYFWITLTLASEILRKWNNVDRIPCPSLNGCSFFPKALSPSALRLLFS